MCLLEYPVTINRYIYTHPWFHSRSPCQAWSSLVVLSRSELNRKVAASIVLEKRIRRRESFQARSIQVLDQSVQMVGPSRPQFVLFGSSIVQYSFANGGWGAILADVYARKVLKLFYSYWLFLW